MGNAGSAHDDRKLGEHALSGCAGASNADLVDACRRAAEGLPFTEVAFSRRHRDEDKHFQVVGFPSYLPELRVSFSSGQATLGSKVTLDSAEQPPEVCLPPDAHDRLRVGARVAICLLDIDAPVPLLCTHAPYLLWYVVDAVVGQDGRIDVGKGSTVMEYTPPSPYSVTGPHRVVAMVYEQLDNKIDHRAFVREQGRRANRSSSNLVQHYNLAPHPLAGFLLKVEAVGLDGFFWWALGYEDARATKHDDIGEVNQPAGAAGDELLVARAVAAA